MVGRDSNIFVKQGKESYLFSAVNNRGCEVEKKREFREERRGQRERNFSKESKNRL